MKNKSASKSIIKNKSFKQPLTSIYDLSFETLDGNTISLDRYRGKKILLVNTASDCGFTPQYESLEDIYRNHSDTLEVIGFPANDFKQQEKKSNEEIAVFCKKNYGVSFPLSQKISVVKGVSQHKIYQWLTKREMNGWNDKQPSWNFSKYLIDEKGMLISYLEPMIDPSSEAFKSEAGI